MTDKNRPLRSIDQKTISTTPAPSTRPTKFNPYTGGIIKGAEQSRYRVFLDSDEDWVLQEFNIKVKSGSSAEDTIKIRVPTLVIRIFNANFSVDKLRVYLAFSKEAFDEDDSITDSLTDTQEPLESYKIISFTTNSITSINSNNASREISSFVRDLIKKHTMYEMLQLMYDNLTTEQLNTLGYNERIRLFNDGLYSLRVYAQVAFIPLSPVNDIDNTPFILRSPITSSYRLTPAQLRGADLSDARLSINNKSINFSVDQVSIDSFNYSVKDNLNRDVVTPRDYAIREVNGVKPKKVSLNIDVSNYTKLETKFNNYTSAISQATLTSLLSSSFTFTLTLNSVFTSAKERKVGSQITSSFDIPTTYSVSYGTNIAFTEQISLPVPVLNLINGSRVYQVGIPSGSAITGVLFVYKFSNNTLVPRYYALSGKGTAESAGYTYYTIQDYFRITTGSNATYKINTKNAVSVDIYPVNDFGRCSPNKLLVPLAGFVDLSKDIQNNLNGYYRQSISLNGTRQLVFSPGTRINNSLRLEIPFRVVVQIKQNGLYKTVYTSAELYRATIEYSGTSRKIKFLRPDNSTLDKINLSSVLGSSGYRILLAPDSTALTTYSGSYIQTGGIGHIGMIQGV